MLIKNKVSYKEMMESSRLGSHFSSERSEWENTEYIVTHLRDKLYEVQSVNDDGHFIVDTKSWNCDCSMDLFPDKETHNCVHILAVKKILKKCEAE